MLDTKNPDKASDIVNFQLGLRWLGYQKLPWEMDQPEFQTLETRIDRMKQSETLQNYIQSQWERHKFLAAQIADFYSVCHVPLPNLLIDYQKTYGDYNQIVKERNN